MLTSCRTTVCRCLHRRKVRGTVGSYLGMHEIVSGRGNKSRAAMFILDVTEVLDDWPEKRRRRKVVSEGGSRAGV